MLGIRTTSIYNSIENIDLPVPTNNIEVECGKSSSTTNLLDFGEINNPGKDTLKTFSISSFFPAHDYSFLAYKRKSNPYDYVLLLERIKKGNVKCKVTVHYTTLDLWCTIEDFKYSEQDGTGDVYFTITFKEWKTVSVASTNIVTVNPRVTAVKSITKKATSNGNSRTYVVKKGDTLMKLSKKFYGTTGKYKYLAQLNRIKNPNLIYVNQRIKY